MYSSPLRTTYYAYDEGYLILDRPAPLWLGLYMLFKFGLFNGRPISYFLWGTELGIVAREGGLHWYRVFHFAVSSGVAAYFYRLLRRRDVSPWWALFLVLLIWSQPVIQIYYFVSLRTAYWLGFCASCWAFTMVHATPAADLRSPRRLVKPAALLMVSWMTFQATPFCGLAPLAYYALTAAPDTWRDERRKYLAFIATVLATMVVYTAAYKILLALTDARTYALARHVFAIPSETSAAGYLEWLRPTNYLGPFEWWNYLYPLTKLSELRWSLLTGATAVAWLGASAVAFAIEARQRSRSYVRQKYAIAFVAAGLTFFPLIADRFATRQNVYIACVPAITLIFAYAISVIVGALRPRRVTRMALATAATVVLAMVCAGAREGFDRALVYPNVRFYDSVLEQIRGQVDARYDRILVITAPHVCEREPCRGVHGYRMSLAGRRDLPQFYRALVRRNGGRPDMPVEFVEGRELGRGDLRRALVIDHRRLR
jgi:hypothetical protein